jgi:hypothetical protein
VDFPRSLATALVFLGDVFLRGGVASVVAKPLLFPFSERYSLQELMLEHPMPNNPNRKKQQFFNRCLSV